MIINDIELATKNGAKFASFVYDKGKEGKSKREVLINVDVYKAQKKRDKEVTKTNWTTGNRTGNLFVKKDGKIYLTAYERGDDGKYIKLKNFNIEKISDFTCKS